VIAPLAKKDSKSTLYCSFCGKSQHRVATLIAGPTVFICDECVDLCATITKSGIVSDPKGDEFFLNISVSTLDHIETMSFPSLESFFSSTKLGVVDGGPYTGAEIFKAVREILQRRFISETKATQRLTDIATLQAKINEMRREHDAMVEPLLVQLERLMLGDTLSKQLHALRKESQST